MNELETKKISKLLFKYSFPCILSLLVGALYNIVDQLFIANSYLSSNGNAANTICYPLTVISLALAVMVGDGCCTYISMKMGQREVDKASNACGNSIKLVIIISIIMTILYLALNLNFFNSNLHSPILDLFGADFNDSLTYSYASEYLFYITLGLPAYILGQALNPIIRADQNPNKAMLYSIMGAIINIIFDPLFIFAFKWGMMGAAIATIIGQIVTAVLSINYLKKLKSFSLNRKSFKLDKDISIMVVKLGICSFLSQFSLVLAMMAINNTITKYSPEAGFTGIYSSIPMAVVGIVMKVFQIIISIAVGASAGSIPLIGYNMGAEKKERVKKIIIYLLLFLLILGIISFLIIMFLSPVLINLFGGKNTNTTEEFNQRYVAFGIKCFRTYLCMVILAVINKGAFIILQAMGKAFSSTLLSMIREILFGVGFTYLLPLWFSLDGVLYSMPVSDILAFIISLIIFIFVFKSLNNKKNNISL